MENINEKWIIVDWTNRRLFKTCIFDSFEDGWEFIYETIPDEDNSYDDVFVITLEEYNKLHRR